MPSSRSLRFAMRSCGRPYEDAGAARRSPGVAEALAATATPAAGSRTTGSAAGRARRPCAPAPRRRRRTSGFALRRERRQYERASGLTTRRRPAGRAALLIVLGEERWTDDREGGARFCEPRSLVRILRDLSRARRSATAASESPGMPPDAKTLALLERRARAGRASDPPLASSPGSGRRPCVDGEREALLARPQLPPAATTGLRWSTRSRATGRRSA
jgi:hypothetical protein